MKSLCENPVQAAGTAVCTKFMKMIRSVYFAAMDEVMAEAERRHVGIIASLMWMESAIACYVKEKAVPYWRYRQQNHGVCQALCL